MHACMPCDKHVGTLALASILKPEPYIILSNTLVMCRLVLTHFSPRYRGDNADFARRIMLQIEQFARKVGRERGVGGEARKEGGKETGRGGEGSACALPCDGGCDRHMKRRVVP